MRIATPFGEYPFVYRRVERREDGVAVVGTVAGVDSAVVFDGSDARRAAAALAVPAAALILLLLARTGARTRVGAQVRRRVRTSHNSCR